jgi:hypothetical protein
VRHHGRIKVYSEDLRRKIVEAVERGKPKVEAARARERYKVVPVKDNRFDAFLLADALRHEHQHWRRFSLPYRSLGEIKALTRDHARLLGISG